MWRLVRYVAALTSANHSGQIWSSEGESAFFPGRLTAWILNLPPGDQAAELHSADKAESGALAPVTQINALTVLCQTRSNLFVALYRSRLQKTSCKQVN